MPPSVKSQESRHVLDREQTYARKPFVKTINALPHMYWHGNTNWGNGQYVSGLPDGEIKLHGGHFIGVECKAAGKGNNLGALYLGSDDPNDTDTSGWSVAQRRYWRDWYQPYDMPYFLVAWVYSESHIPCHSQILTSQSHLFVVPPEAWLSLEAKLDGRTRTIGLTPATAKFKEFGLLDEWGAYRLNVEKSHYVIPQSHVLWQTMQRFTH